MPTSKTERMTRIEKLAEAHATLDEIGAEILAITKQITALQREAELVRNAPIHRTDAAKLLEEWVDSRVEQYQTRTSERLRQALSQSSGAKGLQRGGYDYAAGGPVPDLFEALVDESTTSGALLFVVGPDAIKKKLTAQILATEVPGEGAPAAERAKMLERIAKDIAEREAERAELQSLKATAAKARASAAKRSAKAAPVAA